MTFVLGLTGGIATGKSTAVKFFQEKQIPIIDSDVIARQIVEPGQQGLKNVVAVFGSDILTLEGSLNRKALGQLVFADKAKRKLLDTALRDVLREAILGEIKNYREQGVPLVVVDIPLLYEAGYQQEVDRVMVIKTTSAIQLERLMKRNQFSLEEAKQRVTSQLSIEDKALLGDILIDNSGTIEQTRQQLSNWLTNKVD